MDEKAIASYDGNALTEEYSQAVAAGKDAPDPERYNDEVYLEKHRTLFLSDYGPASERGIKTWNRMCHKWGFEFVARVEGLDDYQMRKKLGLITFQQELKEKFRQKNLARLNS